MSCNHVEYVVRKLELDRLEDYVDHPNNIIDRAMNLVSFFVIASLIQSRVRTVHYCAQTNDALTFCAVLDRFFYA